MIEIGPFCGSKMAFLSVFFCYPVDLVHLSNNFFPSQNNLQRMLNELKAFLLRGDVLALAIAVIIGGAFQKIVDSLVADVMMPILAMVTGNADFSAIKVGPVLIGNFVNAVINFLIVGTALFLVVKAAGKKAGE
jgi:large conductance mechanosensitive channel